MGCSMTTNEEDLKLIGQLSDEKFCWYSLGLDLACLLATARISRSPEDRVFYQELILRVLDYRKDDEQALAKFKGWVDKNFYFPT